MTQPQAYETKSFLSPTINKDGEIGEITLPDRRPVYDLVIKVSFEQRRKDRLATGKEEPRDRLRIERFVFCTGKDHESHVSIYVSEKFRADPRLTEDQRTRLVERYVLENAAWFFTYGERVK